MKEIPDFRKRQGQRYNLHHLLTISVLALVSGADTFEDFAAFCEGKSVLLVEKGLLKPGQKPSHDIFRWLFMRIDSAAFVKLLCSWLDESVQKTRLPTEASAAAEGHKMIHIDGKSLRATRTSEHSRTALQIVSAYVSRDALCLGQLLIDGKSSEKTAIPQLIDLLDLKNSTVTIDAAGTMKTVAQKIREKGGDYVLALKKNNRIFYQEVEDFFRVFDGTNVVSQPYVTEDKGHGRQETRVCRTVTDMQYFPDAQEWTDLGCLISIQSTQVRGQKTVQETRFYITSLNADSTALAESVRKHWTVENNLHWSLDVAFGEDLSKIKHKKAANNMSAIRRFALGVMKNVNLSKNSIKTQRLLAAWDDNFLIKLFDILF